MLFKPIDTAKTKGNEVFARMDRASKILAKMDPKGINPTMSDGSSYFVRLPIDLLVLFENYLGLPSFLNLLCSHRKLWVLAKEKQIFMKVIKRSAATEKFIKDEQMLFGQNIDMRSRIKQIVPVVLPFDNLLAGSNILQILTNNQTFAHFVVAPQLYTASFLMEKKKANPLVLIETTRYPVTLSRQSEQELARISNLTSVLRNSSVGELKVDEMLYIPDLDIMIKGKLFRCAVVLMKPPEIHSGNSVNTKDSYAIIQMFHSLALCAQRYGHDSLVLSDFGCRQVVSQKSKRMEASVFGHYLNLWIENERIRVFKHLTFSILTENLQLLQNSFLNRYNGDRTNGKKKCAIQ